MNKPEKFSLSQPNFQETLLVEDLLHINNSENKDSVSNITPFTGDFARGSDSLNSSNNYEKKNSFEISTDEQKIPRRSSFFKKNITFQSRDSPPFLRTFTFFFKSFINSLIFYCFFSFSIKYSLFTMLFL